MREGEPPRRMGRRMGSKDGVEWGTMGTPSKDGVEGETMGTPSKDGVEGETMGFPSLYKLVLNIVSKIGS